MRQLPAADHDPNPRVFARARSLALYILEMEKRCFRLHTHERTVLPGKQQAGRTIFSRPVSAHPVLQEKSQN